MKINIVGASTWVNRMFEACGNYQWAREFLRNALEADAKNIEFGIEWQAVASLGVYRRTIIDDGCGMSADELREFFSTLGAGAKKIGGVHDNFGVGAKIASLPWNPNGVVVISYKDGRASMIWIALDSETGDYELEEFSVDGELSCVIDPNEVEWDEGTDWSSVRPDWIKEHGTVIVLLGSDEYPDTILGNPDAGEGDIKGLSVYLNTRFWDLASVEVKVSEVRSEHKNQWPERRDERDDSRRPNNRTIRGAKFYLTDVEGSKGKLAATGVLSAEDGRVPIEWYLWEGERPAIHSYAKKPGYVAIRYNGELFQLTSSKVHFRWFGVVESKVQQNLTIILEPQHFQVSNGRWGVHPDQSRNRLIFTGGGAKGVDLPMSDWGLEFADEMPEIIREAIRKARGELGGSIEDEGYRKRLQDKFGDRWTMKVLVKKKGRGGEPATETEIEVPTDPIPKKPKTRRKGKKRHKVLRKKFERGGPDGGVEREAAVDIPRYRFAPKEDFEQSWHLAAWAPHDADGPTVVINVDSPVLQEIVEYHQGHYPDVYAEEVADSVRKVFGEVATCKIAHSQKLTKEIPEEQLDKDYRSEAALTIALMGLLAEESLIAQRLGRLGRKRAGGDRRSAS